MGNLLSLVNIFLFCSKIDGHSPPRQSILHLSLGMSPFRDLLKWTSDHKPSVRPNLHSNRNQLDWITGEATRREKPQTLGEAHPQCNRHFLPRLLLFMAPNPIISI